MADTEITSAQYGRRRSDLSGLRKLASENIINVDGNYGLFTPLTNGQDNEVTIKRNLEEIVEVMRQELAAVKAQNTELIDKLRRVTQKPARTPDDFVTAIQHSVDSLQSKLSTMKNPISDFVVSEFNLDTRVFIDVSPFGTIDYRFVQPGDNVDPVLTSRLTLKIQPVPKQTQTGSFDRANFTPFVDIDEIQGIGDAYKEKLKTQNIYTVSDLLHAGTRVRSRVELASMLGVEQRRLGEWLGHAELMTVKHIDGRAAEVLYEIGITNLETLATTPSNELLEKYNTRVAEKQHASLQPTTQEQVELWVKAAGLYVGKKQPSQTDVK